MSGSTTSAPQHTISCCQGVPSCSRPVGDWLDNDSPSGMSLCRHGSNGLFGCIRENDADTFHFYLTSLTSDQKAQCFKHETNFGDTMLIFAASLGRVDIAQNLLNSIVDTLKNSPSMLLSDFVNHESSRGKIALVEAIRKNHGEVVDLLLSFHAQTRALSRVHKKSALDWARLSEQVSLVNRINEHHRVNDHIHELFVAMTKHDIDKVIELTEGGAPYHWNQDQIYDKELKDRQNNATIEKASIQELKDELSRVDKSIKELNAEMQQRAEYIKQLQSQQQDITSSRTSQTIQALAKVRHAATPNHILGVLSEFKPPIEDLITAKGMCTLLQVNKQHSSATKSNDHIYWRKFQELIKDFDSFYHRMRHFFYNKETISIAANVKVEGSSMICSNFVNSILKRTNETDKDNSSLDLLHSIRNWLHVIFETAEGHEQEIKLLQKESEERLLYERNGIDHEVLLSSRCIIRREVDDTITSIATNEDAVIKLQRKLYVSKVMSFVTASCHTVLSWAVSSGNDVVLKQVLKNGAHTAIGEETINQCAMIIQIAFRRYLLRQSFNKLATTRISQEQRFEHRAQCLAMTMRISALHRLIRRRLSRIRLPLTEALFSGHSRLIKILRESTTALSDVTIFQSMNLAPMFCIPRSSIPLISALNSPYIIEANLASLVISCVLFQYEKEPTSCRFVTSLQYAIELVDEHLLHTKKALEAKMKTRRESLIQKHRQLKLAELKRAMREENYVDMARISSQNGISLDYEDDDTKMTPLILAAMRDESAANKQELRMNGKAISAVVYLIDRISPYKPTLEFESSTGHSALFAACSYGRLQAVNELIDRGANIDKQSIVSGKSALMVSCMLGKLPIVKLLIRRGADVDLVDHSGRTAFSLAIQNRHYDVSEYLTKQACGT